MTRVFAGDSGSEGLIFLWVWDPTSEAAYSSSSCVISRTTGWFLPGNLIMSRLERMTECASDFTEHFFKKSDLFRSSWQLFRQETGSD